MCVSAAVKRERESLWLNAAVHGLFCKASAAGCAASQQLVFIPSPSCPPRLRRKKMLLMGKSGSGKSSMKSIVFANFLARDTARLTATLAVQHSSVRFLGNMVLNLWDCGGQDAFYENYFNSKREHTFSNVAVLIYVFDITSEELEKDLRYYQATIENLAALSPDARIFVLIHKMDLVPELDREAVFKDRTEVIRSVSLGLQLVTFRTSIWDETLYKAWSSIVYSLIPNIKQLEDKLGELAERCDADELVLFEKATFLVISHATRKVQSDVHRFEKISNIVKQFKLSCA